ncbi:MULTISPECIES: formyltransferase family protein [Methylomicrobium]|uniref:Methionyl-tRNA formyltransferase n=1 Tax=Methylomicrobium album BG8 TaxID=686340 RepID=H8GGT5_METAL|nr:MULTISPECIES: formyltransferase family protein [Methylomicrobium]EIC30048.1 methionyl-tRNA formyltransferase [Methylomicrobium album BG8]
MKQLNPSRSILMCLDNRVGYECLKFLLNDPETKVCGAVVHPRATALFGDEILAACEAAGVPAFEFQRAREHFDEIIRPLEPDYVSCFYFDYVLDERFLSLPKIDTINVHPGYLPYNKGFFYYVWSVLDGTPAGVSVHRMNSAADAGDLYAQALVEVTPEDTGDTLYRKHEDAAIQLFRATWPSIVDGTYRSHPQRHPGTRHKLNEMSELLRLDPDERLRTRDLIDRLRVCTVPGRSGCIVDIDGESFQVELQLKPVPCGFVPSPPGKRD